LTFKSTPPPSPQKTPVEVLIELGRALHGEHWIGPTARDLGIKHATLAAFVSGKTRLHADSIILDGLRLLAKTHSRAVAGGRAVLTRASATTGPWYDSGEDKTAAAFHGSYMQKEHAAVTRKSGGKKTPVDDLIELGRTLHGEHWINPTGRDLEISHHALWNLVSGQLRFRAKPILDAVRFLVKSHTQAVARVRELSMKR
jgi:hypothetical protein